MQLERQPRCGYAAAPQVEKSKKDKNKDKTEEDDLQPKINHKMLLVGFETVTKAHADFRLQSLRDMSLIKGQEVIEK